MLEYWNNRIHINFHSEFLKGLTFPLLIISHLRQKSSPKADTKVAKPVGLQNNTFDPKSACWIRRVRWANFVRGAN
jgi:hypothetical protein